MMTEKTYCFVDESGNKTINLESEATPKFFVFTATLVKESQLEEAIEGAERIRRLFFQSGEMKSSGIGSNSDRRKKIIANISTLPIQTVILAIEKEEIFKDSGLKWQKSFFKYASKLLFTKLILGIQPIEILQDEHGDAEFMKEFEDYISRNLSDDLFSSANERYTFSFANSKSSALIQVSDILGGTYLRILSGSETQDFEGIIMRILQQKILYIDHWPPRYKHRRIEAIPEFQTDRSLDENIESYCIRKVNEFNNKKRIPGLEEARVDECKTFLRYLLHRLDAGPRDAYVPTKRILAFLGNAFGKAVNMQHLRTKIVASVRDQGVIIASGPKGYKIPTCYMDVHSFINHGNGIIPPMVSRLKIARDAVRIVSFGKSDVLDREEFSVLKDIVDATR